MKLLIKLLMNLLEKLSLSLLSFWYVWAFIGLVVIFALFRLHARGSSGRGSSGSGSSGRRSFGVRSFGVRSSGVKSVRKILSRLDPSEYKVINNLTLNVNDQPMQINHVVISNCGIFVIHTQDHRGRIFGNEFQEYWIQTTNRSRGNILNPVRQNYRGIVALKQLACSCPDPAPAPKYFSIIVFTGKTHLSIIARSAEVIHAEDLLDTIDALEENRVKIISSEKRNELYKLLQSEKIRAVQERKKQVEDEKDEKDAKDEKDDRSKQGNIRIRKKASIASGTSIMKL